MTQNARDSRPVLYHYWRSSSSWRVRWALSHKGIDYTPVAVDLLKGAQRSPEHLQRNPLGAVPVLNIDGLELGESMAILEYLEETHPERPLLPAAPRARARVRQLCQIIVADTQPLQNLSVLEHVAELVSDPEQRRPWAERYIARGFDGYEALLRRDDAPAGPCSFGDEVTLADLCLVPQCLNARRQGLDVGRWPRIAAIEAHCLRTAAAQASAPEAFKPG
jgi:maleylacetoacetate isomerase